MERPRPARSLFCLKEEEERLINRAAAFVESRMGKTRMKEEEEEEEEEENKVAERAKRAEKTCRTHEREREREADNI